MTLRTAPINEGGANPSLLGWAEYAWLWLHPPPSRLDSKPGAAKPPSEALNVSFLGLCIFGSDKAQEQRGLGKGSE